MKTRRPNLLFRAFKEKRFCQVNAVEPLQFVGIYKCHRRCNVYMSLSFLSAESRTEYARFVQRSYRYRW
jgi:hypothetical protein